MSEIRQSHNNNGSGKNRGPNRPPGGPPSKTTLPVEVRAGAHKGQVTNALFMDDGTWRRLETIARRAFEGGVLPATIKNIQGAFIALLKGVSLGLDPLYAMEHVIIIGGKCTIDGQAMLAVIYRDGRVTIEWPASENPAKTRTVTMIRQGQKSFSSTWTIERAKAAGLTSKDPWQKFPENMLMWRCVAEAARAVCPDVIAGMYMPEELGQVVDEDGRIVDVPETRVTGARPVGEAASSNEGGKSEVATPAPEEKHPSKEQLSRLWTLAHDHGWSKEGVHTLIGEWFGGKSSSAQLSIPEYNRLCAHLLKNKVAPSVAVEATGVSGPPIDEGRCGPDNDEGSVDGPDVDSNGAEIEEPPF